MKKILLLTLLSVFFFGHISAAIADGCYMCDGGTFVKFTGTDDQTKRKAAKACGCEIHGTRGDCSAANLKVICSVLDSTHSYKDRYVFDNQCNKDDNSSEKDESKDESKI